MTDSTSLDRQLGDIVWIMTALLRSGYSVKQIIESLANEAPEPSKSVFQSVSTNLASGKSLLESLQTLQTQYPTTALPNILATFFKQLEEGGNLADRLQPLAESIRTEKGTDSALYGLMHRVAERTQTSLPKHIN